MSITRSINNSNIFRNMDVVRVLIDEDGNVHRCKIIVQYKDKTYFMSS